MKSKDVILTQEAKDKMIKVFLALKPEERVKLLKALERHAKELNKE